MWKPEILAPAGNLERLKIACLYGADAIYLGGQKFGLRARADNFTETELRKGVAFAHARGVKVYVVLNAFLHDEDFDGLEDFCAFLEEIQVDAVIVSDLGVMRRVAAACKVPIHTSTQASCVNEESARLWTRLGAERVIVGRELTIEETGAVGRNVGVEVEMFVHGALCMAYSGNCTISNFTAGRDSNRGGCIQSCRFEYDQSSSSESDDTEESASVGSHFMSSRDLLGIAYVPQFFEERISSLKIEGRMKSALYVATVSKCYRTLVDAYASGEFSPELVDKMTEELLTLPHRQGFEASLDTPASEESIYEPEKNAMPRGTHRFIGTVVDVTDEFVSIRTYAQVKVGDVLEILPFEGETISCTIEELHMVSDGKVESVRQESVARIPRTNLLANVAPLQVVRRAWSQEEQ